MAKTEFKNGPDLAGLAIAAGMGVAAFALCVVLGGFDLTPAVAISGGIAAVVAVILGLPLQPLPAPGTVVIRTPVIGAAKPAPVTTHLSVQAAVPPAEAPIAAPEPAAIVAAAAPASAFVAMVPEATDGPLRLSAARGGVADDLKEIEGIGPALETLCNDLGFYHYDQIAQWTEADVTWVDDNMPRFKGRIARDKWVEQARLIVAEGLDAFRIRAKTNEY